MQQITAVRALTLLLASAAISSSQAMSLLPQATADADNSQAVTEAATQASQQLISATPATPPAEAEPQISETSAPEPILTEPPELSDQITFREPEAPAPQDLWRRLQLGLSLPIPADARVQREIDWYTSHPEYLGRLQERAAPYLHFILEEIDKRQMPAELALLPAVESAFQPFAYSPGRAAGLWQFIPSTGRLYGLKQNWWYDGRRDIVAATHSALDYLQALNQQFDGDWELALAAYNCGAGNVRKAIRRNQKKGKPTDFWSLKLPKETSAYVPRLLAISAIFANPEQHGISLKPLPDQPHFTTIDIQSQLDLALAAEMADIDIEQLYLLNPGFNRWATDPAGPHQLNLPLDKVEGFLTELATLPAEKRLRWKRYKIRSGDSLSVIARKHGTTTKLLQQVNNLKGNRIRAGKHLLIPISTKRLNHYALSSKQRKSKLLSKSRKGNKQIYIVQKGDSFWEIAKRHGISYRKLAKWNGMAPGDPIRPGQKLVFWVNKATSTHVSLPTTQPSGTRSKIAYKVRRGDSLARIAKRFRVSVADLRKWNKLPEKYLQPGQKIRLYVDVTAQTL
jgi:membrane-bound lytic murein transglycosylase D